MVPDVRRGLRREQVAAGGLEEFQHRLVFKRGRIGEVDHHLRAGQDLFESFAGDGVDAAVGRGGDDLVAALAQNGNGLRADQAGAADDDDLHGLPLSTRVTPRTLLTHVITQLRVSGLVRMCCQIMPARYSTLSKEELFAAPVDWGMR